MNFKEKGRQIFVPSFILAYPVLGLSLGFIAGEGMAQRSQKVAVDRGEKVPGSVMETGNYTVAGVKFELLENVTSEDSDPIGKAFMDENKAQIEVNRSVEDFYTTCVHEYWGHLESNYYHPGGGDSENDDEWIDEMEDQVVSETCLKLLYRLNGGKTR